MLVFYPESILWFWNRKILLHARGISLKNIY